MEAMSRAILFFSPLCAVYEVKRFHGMFNFEKFVAESNHAE